MLCLLGKSILNSQLYSSGVVLTGAGIFAESSIKTFRARDGLWENHRIEDVASPEGFAKNPSLVSQFCNPRRQQLGSPEIIPNQVHRTLANVEARYDGEFLLLTLLLRD